MYRIRPSSPNPSFPLEAAFLKRASPSFSPISSRAVESSIAVLALGSSSPVAVVMNPYKNIVSKLSRSNGMKELTIADYPPGGLNLARRSDMLLQCRRERCNDELL